MAADQSLRRMRGAFPKFVAFFCAFAGAGFLFSASAQERPVSATKPSDIAQDLVFANRILSQAGVLDGFGHVSVRNPASPDRFYMARNIAPASVTASDILEFDFNGQTAGSPSVAIERFIHAAIYRARPDVNAVVHGHTPSTIPFSVSGVALRPVFLNAAFLMPQVPVFESRNYDQATDMLVKNEKLGAALAEVLGQNNVVLLRGHDVVVTAPSLPIVTFRSVYTDINAQMQLQSSMLGGNIKFLDRAEAEAVDKLNIRVVGEKFWDLAKRKIENQ